MTLYRCSRYPVTPRVGVWIETLKLSSYIVYLLVTPRVGVWIETPELTWATTLSPVTPRVGVWIETASNSVREANLEGHSPRGSVD